MPDSIENPDLEIEVESEPIDEEGNSEDFDNVEIYDGKVAGFMYCGGDGPTCEIIESELS